MKNKRNIREEMMTISGGQFKKWYEELSKEEKIEYNFILEKIKNPTLPKEIDLSEAINFWILNKGNLDVDTLKLEIYNFYIKNKK